MSVARLATTRHPCVIRSFRKCPNRCRYASDECRELANNLILPSKAHRFYTINMNAIEEGTESKRQDKCAGGIEKE